jgi:hypothetical protein
MIFLDTEHKFRDPTRKDINDTPRKATFTRMSKICKCVILQ